MNELLKIHMKCAELYELLEEQSKLGYPEAKDGEGALLEEVRDALFQLGKWVEKDAGW